MSRARWRIVAAGAALLACLATVLAGFSITRGASDSTQAPVSDAGLDIFASGTAECIRSGTAEAATACMNDLVLELSPVLGTSTVFQGALKAVTEHKDLLAKLCHRTFHYIGEYAGKSVGDVPKALQLGGPECEFGYYHGVVEGHASVTPTLWDELPQLCAFLSTDRNSYVYQECSHSLGHAVVTRTDNNVPEGVERCRLMETDPERSACATGIFMSWSNKLDGLVASGQELTGKWLWAPERKRYEKCPEFDDLMAGACVLFFAETVEHNPEGFGKFRAWCKKAFEGRALPSENCHRGVGRVSGGYEEFEWMGRWRGIVDFCMTGYTYEEGKWCVETAYGSASGFQQDPKLIEEACAAWDGSPYQEEQCAIVKSQFESTTADVDIPSVPGSDVSSPPGGSSAGVSDPA